MWPPVSARVRGWKSPASLILWKTMQEEREPADHPHRPNDEPIERVSVVWHYTRVTIGIVLCGIGILGTLLPVIPGVPLIVAGVALLGTDHWLVKPVKDRVDRWRGL